MITKTQAIVLHSFRYNDSSTIVAFLTRQHGRISCMIHGIGSKKSKFKPAYFQPLSILEIEYTHHQNKELQTLKDVSSIQPLHSLHSSIYKNAIVFFLGEMLYRSVKDGEHNEHLYQFVQHSIELLDTMTEGFANFHVLFLSQLSKYLGFFPDNRYSELTPFFNAKTASFEMGRLQYSLDRQQSILFSTILDTDYSGANSLILTQTLRNDLVQAFIDFYILHLPGIKEIKSFDVLRMVFS